METLSITNLYDGSYAYDVFGRFATSSFEGLDFNYTYLSGSDRVAGIAYGAVEKMVSYERLRDLVTGISYYNTNGLLIAERKYAYNGIGNVLSRTRQRGTESVESDVFGHNVRSELIAASLGGTNAVSGDYGYAYDPIGNRVAATNRSDVTAYASNELNQYTNIVSEVEFTPAFDDDGNQILVKTSTGIWHVTYNAENRPVVWSNATSVIAMDYDHMGRRIRKTGMDGGAELSHTFLYDGYLQVASIETNAVTTTFWDPTERIATRPLAMKVGGEVFTYTHDLTKNVMDVLDSAGIPVVVYDYDAFGAMTASRSYLSRIGFSSEYYDSELGCVYYNYRHYNPLDGRWMSRDPIGEGMAKSLLLSCNNSPVRLFDKKGLMMLVAIVDPTPYKKPCCNGIPYSVLDSCCLDGVITPLKSKKTSFKKCCWYQFYGNRFDVELGFNLGTIELFAPTHCWVEFPGGARGFYPSGVHDETSYPNLPELSTTGWKECSVFEASECYYDFSKITSCMKSRGYILPYLLDYYMPFNDCRHWSSRTYHFCTAAGLRPWRVR